MTDPAARKLFKEILGDGIIDAYGSAETGSCMLKLFDSPEHIIHYDAYVINIYDENDRLADAGSVVITPLFKTDIPLINYKIGDKAISEVRDGVRYVTGLQGRMNDFFRYDTGEVTTFFEIAPIMLIARTWFRFVSCRIPTPISWFSASRARNPRRHWNRSKKNWMSIEQKVQTSYGYRLRMVQLHSAGQQRQTANDCMQGGREWKKIN